jgi:hypothetical protein
MVELLNRTIKRAVELSPYYAEVFRGLDVRLNTSGDLQRFPLLTRETFARRGQDLMASGDVPVTVSMTGGTTLGREGRPQQLLIFRTAQEGEVRRELFSALQSLTEPRPLLLHLVNMGHGYDPEGGREGCFQVPLERPFNFDTILTLLRREFDFSGYTRRVKVVAGPLRLLKALTLLCMEKEIDARQFDVELVTSSSNQLTARWRALLESFWGAAVDDAYGLSEVPGLHARRCTSCTHFHFSPLAVAEILRLDRDEPAETGIGRLIATSLFPLAAMQPIIRYDTGDLVEIKEMCAEAGRVGYEFMGRLSDAVFIPGEDGPRLLLAPIVLNEILDAVPDIAYQEFTFAKALGLKCTVGAQKWHLSVAPSGRPLRVDLMIELCWSPLVYAAEAERLRERLTQQIFAAATAFSDAVAAAEVDFHITFHEPQSTNLKTVI